jgi:hypothetical protein
MNVSKFFRLTVLSFCLSTAVICALTFWADDYHSQLECTGWESRKAAQLPEQIGFDRVAFLFWVSLCAPRGSGLIISASEGTGDLSFQTLARQNGFAFDEMTGAHRGIKTLGFMLSAPIAETRRRNLKPLVLLNPVYFGFAAPMDSAAMRRSSLSALSFVYRAPFVRGGSNLEYIISPLVTANGWIGQFRMLEQITAHPPSDSTAATMEIKQPENYDLAHNMLESKVENYKTFKDELDPNAQPTKDFLAETVKYLRQQPSPTLCLILLPANAILLERNGVQAKESLARFQSATADIPEKNKVDLTSLSYDPYIFQDSMHFTDYGKLKIWKAIAASPCFQAQFAKAAP